MDKTHKYSVRKRRTVKNRLAQEAGAFEAQDPDPFQFLHRFQNTIILAKKSGSLGFIFLHISVPNNKLDMADRYSFSLTTFSPR